jgi:hypothetical protein
VIDELRQSRSSATQIGAIAAIDEIDEIGVKFGTDWLGGATTH